MARTGQGLFGAGAFVLFTSWVAPAAAQGGGLNAEGCHTNRKAGDYPATGRRPPVALRATRRAFRKPSARAGKAAAPMQIAPRRGRRAPARSGG